MSLADEITIVEGHGTAPPNPYVFYMPGIPGLCIRALGEEDGPAGVADQLTGVTQLPAGVGLAATWDPSLASRYGQVIGSEELGKGAAVNLGPTVNIDRDPRWALRGGFNVNTTPAARQVQLQAPTTMTPGSASAVTVKLTASSNATLRRVRLALQLPDGWTARSVGRSSFADVSPWASPTATFKVTPPSYTPASNATVHATADLSRFAQREAGVNVTVGG